MTDEEKERLKNNIGEAMAYLVSVKQLELDTLKFNLALMQGLKAGDLDIDAMAYELHRFVTDHGAKRATLFTKLLHRLWLLSGGDVAEPFHRFEKRQRDAYRAKALKLERVS